MASLSDPTSTTAADEEARAAAARAQSARGARARVARERAMKGDPQARRELAKRMEPVHFRVDPSQGKADPC